MSYATIEKLSAALDYYSLQVLYTFATGLEFDQSMTLTGATTAVQGRSYGYDALGDNPAPVAPGRHIVWHFVHTYAAGESWFSVKDAMIKAFGHGRPILLQKTRPSGLKLLCEARLADFPDHATIDAITHCEFTVTFEMRDDWFNQDITSPRYDTGLHYDAGLHYDVRGVYTNLTGQNTFWGITNNGSVNERGAIIRFDGQITGPFVFYNNTSDPRGRPLATGNPMNITVNTSLAAGEWLAIDCRLNVVQTNKAGLVPWSVVVRAPGQRHYVEFLPGANSVELLKGDASVSGGVLIAARDRYR